MGNVQNIIALLFLSVAFFRIAEAQTYNDDSLIVAELLAVNGCTSTPVDDITFVENGRITSITMCSDLSIRVLPQSIGSLSELTYINLSDNIIDELPATFSNLKKLNSLYLIRNRLTKWPDVFYDMPNLEIIDVGGNNLTRLPDDISDCGHIKKLYINDNYLTQLPESIVQLDLELVHVPGNSLQNLSEPIIQWLEAKAGPEWNKYQDGFCGNDSIYVQRILSDKGLPDLPNDSVATIVNGCITALDLSYERLSRFAYPDTVSHGVTLDDMFTYYANFRSINLSGHRMDSLPDWFGEMCHLTYLNLSDNNFTTLPIFMVAFKNLDSLNLSGNRLESLPPEIKTWADRFDNGWESRQAITHAVCSRRSSVKHVPEIAAIQSSEGKTTISIKFPQPENSEVSIYALSGRKLFTVARKYFTAGAHNLTVNSRKLSAGAFFVTLKSRNGGCSSLKFIKGTH